MKLKRLRDKKRKHSFHIYFIAFSSVIIATSTTIPSVFYWFLSILGNRELVIPQLILVSISSLLVGLILSYYTGRILIAPIKKLRYAMADIANGNFDVSIDKSSWFDEVDDMYHYFNLMVNELKATEIIQSDFISNASHEFKTPLGAIEGYATLLSDKNISEEEKNLYVDKILFNVSRMNLLINNILLLSKIDSSNIHRETSKFYLDEQIRQSILFLEPKWEKKNINFEIDFDIIKFVGYESLLVHVWNNLISNAIKFSPVDGTITMTLHANDEGVVFEIIDEGPGINEDDQKYIFNKFYQLDTSHKEEGYGLGLSLVKKIVDLSLGEVFVENLPEKGCKFKICLPFVDFSQ